MSRFLKPYGGAAYALMRIVLAFLYLSHGLSWLFDAFGVRPKFPITPLFITAGLIETIAGSLMLVGLFSSCAAFIASGEMAVAYFMAHVARTGSIVPIQNGGEITVALCFGFLYMATQGDGPFSVARLLHPARKE